MTHFRLEELRRHERRRVDVAARPHNLVDRVEVQVVISVGVDRGLERPVHRRGIIRCGVFGRWRAGAAPWLALSRAFVVEVDGMGRSDVSVVRAAGGSARGGGSAQGAEPSG